MRLELVSPLKRRTRGTTAVVKKEVVAGSVRQPNVEDARRPCSLTVLFHFGWVGRKAHAGRQGQVLDREFPALPQAVCSERIVY